MGQDSVKMGAQEREKGLGSFTENWRIQCLYHQVESYLGGIQGTIAVCV